MRMGMARTTTARMTGLMRLISQKAINTETVMRNKRKNGSCMAVDFGGKMVSGSLRFLMPPG